MIDNLLEFLKRAEQNYKYKPYTAAELGRALRLFAGVMTVEELSAEPFPLDKLCQIAERLDAKFPGRYTTASKGVFRSRIKRIVRDYRKYGLDTESMASWNPHLTQRNRNSLKNNPRTSGNARSSAIVVSEKIDCSRIELLLQNSRSITFQYPTDLTVEEAEKIGTALKGIVALATLGISDQSPA